MSGKLNIRGNEQPPKNAFAVMAGAVAQPKTGPAYSPKGAVAQPKTQIRPSPGRDMAGTPGRGSMGDWADSHHPVRR